MARRIGTTEADASSPTAVPNFSDTQSTNEANQANQSEESTVTTVTENEVAAEASDDTSTVDAASLTEDPTAESGAADEAKAEPAEIDLTEFLDAVNAAVAQGDEATGEIPTALTQPVTKAYQALSVSGKSKSKAQLLEIMQGYVQEREVSKAISVMQLQKALVPAKPSGAHKPAEPKAPADPNESPATQLAILRTAFGHLKNNLPEGADADAVKTKSDELVATAEGELQSYLDWKNREPVEEGAEDAPEPEVSDVTKKAAQIILTKVRIRASGGGGGQTYSGPRRNVATHISQVFADKASGDFMSIAEIANARSEEYGDDKISSGAITARLFPTDGKVNLDAAGVRPATVDGKRGAVKI